MYIRQALVEADMFEVVNAVIRGHFESRALAIYEAGGGSATIMDAALTQGSDITVVDISPEQIAKMTYARHGIVGDIQEWRRPDHFDLAICFNVLEHVDDPSAALVAICASLRQNGMLVIGGPNPWSLQGWVTRLTPHALHVAFYRLMGQKTAGQKGYAPFPTTFAAGSYPAELVRAAAAQGLRVVMLAHYRDGHLGTIRRRSRLLYGLVRLAFFALRAVTLGVYDASLSNFFLVAVKERPAT